MKIRNGFVSNSSSSSFIVAYHGDLKQELRKAFQLPDNYPLDMSELVVDKFMDRIDEKINNVDELITYWRDQYGENPPEDYIIMATKGFKYAVGSFSSEEYGVEAFLCETSIDHHSTNLVIKSGGGY